MTCCKRRRNTSMRRTRRLWWLAIGRRWKRRRPSLGRSKCMTRRATEFDARNKAGFRIRTGIVLIFVGMLLLGISKVFIGLNFGPGINIFCFFGGATLLVFGFLMEGERRRTR